MLKKNNASKIYHNDSNLKPHGPFCCILDKQGEGYWKRKKNYDVPLIMVGSEGRVLMVALSVLWEEKPWQLP